MRWSIRTGFFKIIKISKIYDGLKQAGQLRLEDEIKFGRSNQWDINDKFGQMYDSHKKHFNESITNVLKFISKKSDIKNPDKEQLSSIFLDPPLVQGENIESHLGPFGEEPPVKSDETKEPCDGLVTTDEKANESEDEGPDPMPVFLEEDFILEARRNERKFYMQSPSYLSVSNS